MTQRDVFLLFYHTSRTDTNCVSRDDRVDDENLKNLSSPPPPPPPEISPSTGSARKRQ